MLNLHSIKMTTLFFASVLLIFGCNEDTFKGSGKGKYRPKKGVYEFPCNSNQASQGQITDTGSTMATMVVEGEFCSVSAQALPDVSLTVMFIVDFSGSMGEGATVGSSGADELIGNSCGRMNAVSAVMNKIVPQNVVSANTKEPSINVGSISFGQNVNNNIPLTSYKNFNGQVTSTNFCGANMRSTNYEAAFKEAEDKLKAITGPKVVYFISDGSPTSRGAGLFGNAKMCEPTGDNKCKEDGIAAAAKMQALPNIDANFIYLENSSSGVSQGMQSDEYRHLVDVAQGRAEKVKVAANAQDLANQLTLIEVPKTSDLNSNEIEGTLSAPGFDTRKVKVQLIPDTSRGVIRYRTSAFKPITGELGQTIAQTLEVQVNSADGSRPVSATQISYTRDR